MVHTTFFDFIPFIILSSILLQSDCLQDISGSRNWHIGTEITILSGHQSFQLISIFFTASSHLIQRSRDREYTVMGYFLHSTLKTFHPGRVSLIISKLVKLSDELDTGELGQWPAQVSQSEKWKWFLLLVTRADSQQSGEAAAEKWTQWKDENCCLFSNLEFWWEGEASIRGSGDIAAVTVRVVRVTREPGLWGAGDQSDESVKVTWSNAANQRPAYLGMIPGSPGTLSRLARLARDLSRELRMSSLSSDSFLVMENNQMFYYDRIQM